MLGRWVVCFKLNYPPETRSPAVCVDEQVNNIKGKGGNKAMSKKGYKEPKKLKGTPKSEEREREREREKGRRKKTDK